MTNFYQNSVPETPCQVLKKEESFFAVSKLLENRWEKDRFLSYIEVNGKNRIDTIVMLLLVLFQGDFKKILLLEQ